MSIGLAIFLVAIIGFAIYSQGFRRLLLWLAVAIGLIVIALLARELNIGHQEQQTARLQAEQQQKQLTAERQEIQQLAPQLCPDLGTQKQCMEDTEAWCRDYLFSQSGLRPELAPPTDDAFRRQDLAERKKCMVP
jgi:hypothetical protein